MDFDFLDDAPVSPSTDTASGGSDNLRDVIQSEIMRLHADQYDIENKLSHTRSQIENLRQRQAMVMAEVKKIDSTLGQTPQQLVRDSYAEALTAQQRLLTIQGQVEKLEAQDAALKQQIASLQSMRELIDRSAAAESTEIFNAREIIIKVIDAQEEERERLARQMHDGPAHSLTNFILQAEIAQKLLDRNPEKAKEELSNLKTAAGEAFQKVRTYIFELRPMMLADLGLAPTLKRFVETFGEKSDVDVSFQQNGPERRMESYREVLMFRAVQAVMANTRDRGGATTIKVSLEMSPERVHVAIEDNGRGLGTGQLSLDSKNPDALGLGSLQDRMSIVGGILQIVPVPAGTRVEISMPSGPEPGFDDTEDLI